jgi:hypothetical protein
MSVSRSTLSTALPQRMLLSRLHGHCQHLIDHFRLLGKHSQEGILSDRVDPRFSIIS